MSISLDKSNISLLLTILILIGSVYYIYNIRLDIESIKDSISQHQIKHDKLEELDLEELDLEELDLEEPDLEEPDVEEPENLEEVLRSMKDSLYIQPSDIPIYYNMPYNTYSHVSLPEESEVPQELEELEESEVPQEPEVPQVPQVPQESEVPEVPEVIAYCKEVLKSGKNKGAECKKNVLPGTVKCKIHV